MPYYCYLCSNKNKNKIYFLAHLAQAHDIGRYSHLRLDRSGARIIDMLYCFSYCFRNGIKYQGSIIKWNFFSSKGSGYRYLNECIELCKLLSLPVPIDNRNGPIKSFQIIPYILYEPKQERNKIFNKLFRDHLISKLNIEDYYLKNSDKSGFKSIDDIKKLDEEWYVAIHIRRGDVTKDGRWWFRYTPNSYYLNIIDIIQKERPDAKIYIFSEEKTDDSFDDFIKKGCTMMLNTDINAIDAWIYFMKSNLFIMSSSLFAIVPALYCKNPVVYVPNKYFTKMSDWIDGNSQNIEEQLLEIVKTD